MFQAYGDKQGPLHGMLINTPYVTKDLLQSKRFQAQTLGTSYVYDIPEMFRQSLIKLWNSMNEHAVLPPAPLPSDILTYTELVLDDQGQLVHMNRLPGGNEASAPSLPAAAPSLPLSTPCLGLGLAIGMRIYRPGTESIPSASHRWNLTPENEIFVSLKINAFPTMALEWMVAGEIAKSLRDVALFLLKLQAQSCLGMSIKRCWFSEFKLIEEIAHCVF
ncbi:hypothetical protein EK904_013028 [Melospiza melodia maxima]|nr:hypothetical protein EK904_013028 [Melospiza melodia maxima]